MPGGQWQALALTRTPIELLSSCAPGGQSRRLCTAMPMRSMQNRAKKPFCTLSPPRSATWVGGPTSRSGQADSLQGLTKDLQHCPRASYTNSCMGCSARHMNKTQQITDSAQSGFSCFTGYLSITYHNPNAHCKRMPGPNTNFRPHQREGGVEHVLFGGGALRRTGVQADHRAQRRHRVHEHAAPLQRLCTQRAKLSAASNGHLTLSKENTDRNAVQNK